MVRPIEWCSRESHFWWFCSCRGAVTIRILVSGKGFPSPIRGRLDPMSRPMFRSTAFLFLSCLGVALAPALAQAQATADAAALGNIAGDPFTFYYAYYLPNQQMQSMRPTPMDSINQAVMNRQYYAQTQKQSLYNPISPYAEDYDPLRPYSQQQGKERIARPFHFAQSSSNQRWFGCSTLLQPRRSIFLRSENRPWAKCERRRHSSRRRPVWRRRWRNGRDGRHGWNGHGWNGHGRNGLIVSHAHGAHHRDPWIPTLVPPATVAREHCPGACMPHRQGEATKGSLVWRLGPSRA